MEYKTKGVCSMAIQYDIDDEQKVHNVKFIGGCSGNTQGVAKLVEGMPAVSYTHLPLNSLIVPPRHGAEVFPV